MKTLTKRKSLMGFIYALVMLLPFSAILVRCLYVTFNKNAYLSYSERYVDNLTLITNSNDFIVNANYKVVYNEGLTSAGNQIYDVYSTSLNDYVTLQETQYITRITFLNDNGTPRIQYLLNDGSSNRIMNWQNVCPTFVFNLKSNSNSYVNTNFASVYMITEVTDSLDNAFDYSLYTFLQENGTGRLNLTDWFTDVFLNRTTHNMLYLNYINWYMNYSLLVSCVYLLYSVLMWFLTFARYVINKPLKEEE